MELKPNLSFSDFIHEADKLFSVGPPKISTVRDLAAYSETIQRRRQCFDIIHRVETMSFAVERLLELSQPYKSVNSFLCREGPHYKDAESFETYSKELENQLLARDRILVESRTLNTFLYYEVTSLAGIFKALGIPVKGEVRYFAKCRDYFLAHPREDSAIRNSAGSSSGGDGYPVLAHIINTGEKDPLLLEHLHGEPFASWTTLLDDWQAGQLSNRQVVESSTMHKKLDATQCTKLRLFGIPEPDIFKFVDELRNLLLTDVLELITRVASEPLYDRSLG